MNLTVGIVGLPNVGKSTLFNALLKKQQAFVANYPFATIEPNIGVVPVPDERLKVLASIVANEDTKILGYKDIKKDENAPNISISQYLNIPPIIPATVKFVDIAGLVKGANEGAGLGNKFLSHIREVSIVAHVVRAFSDENVIREGSSDVKSDYETINTELALADISTAEKIASGRSGEKVKGTDEQVAADKILQELNKGISARDVQLTEDEEKAASQFFLLSKKSEVVVLNVSEEDYKEENIPKLLNKYSELLGIPKEKMVVICAKIEAELSELSADEQKEYLKELGLKESGLERLIKKAYENLNLISFLTAGEKEVRAWTLRAGSTALRASSVIHTDFEKNFIKAEVVSYSDFVESGGWKGAREKGKTRFEGRDYIVKDGDVIEFKIGK